MGKKLTDTEKETEYSINEKIEDIINDKAKMQIHINSMWEQHIENAAYLEDIGRAHNVLVAQRTGVPSAELNKLIDASKVNVDEAQAQYDAARTEINEAQQELNELTREHQELVIQRNQIES